MDVQTIRRNVLLQKMKGNLEKIYQDGEESELDHNGQYLLESIETFEDLYAFLKYEEQIGLWTAVDVFGFMLCLFESEPGFDPGAPLSDHFQKVLNIIERKADYDHNI